MSFHLIYKGMQVECDTVSELIYLIERPRNYDDRRRLESKRLGRCLSCAQPSVLLQFKNGKSRFARFCGTHLRIHNERNARRKTLDALTEDKG